MSERVPAGEKFPNMYETLCLLKLYDAEGVPVFFVVSGLATDDPRYDRNPLDQSYHYDEHSCPTNYVPVEAIMQKYDTDPHGVFDYVRSVWKPADYENGDEAALLEIFPEINT